MSSVAARLHAIDAEIARDHAMYLRCEWNCDSGQARWYADEVDRLRHDRWLLESTRRTHTTETTVIILGIVLLVLAYVLHVSLLWTLGIILLIVGVVLAVAGLVGHGVGGRHHWY